MYSQVSGGAVVVENLECKAGAMTDVNFSIAPLV
jgi:hypothetical protein